MKHEIIHPGKTRADDAIHRERHAIHRIVVHAHAHALHSKPMIFAYIQDIITNKTPFSNAHIVSTLGQRSHCLVRRGGLVSRSSPRCRSRSRHVGRMPTQAVPKHKSPPFSCACVQVYMQVAWRPFLTCSRATPMQFSYLYTAVLLSTCIFGLDHLSREGSSGSKEHLGQAASSIGFR